jgi:hypothetical protein
MFKDLASIEAIQARKNSPRISKSVCGTESFFPYLLLASFVEGFFFSSLVSPTKADHKKYVLNTGPLSQ